MPFLAYKDENGEVWHSLKPVEYPEEINRKIIEKTANESLLKQIDELKAENKELKEKLMAYEFIDKVLEYSQWM